MGTMAAVCVERDRTLVAASASEGYSSVSWRALHRASVFFLVVVFLTQSNSSSTWNMTTRGLWDIKGNWAVVGCILHLVRARPWEHDRVSDDARDYDGLTLKVTANKETHGDEGLEGVEIVSDTIQNSDNPNWSLLIVETEHYTDTESDSDGRGRERRWWYGDRWWRQHRDKARQRQMQQSRRCELCVLAATVPDCSRQLKLQFAVCTVADFLSISFRLQSSKRVMSSNIIFEPQLVIVVRLSCWSTASWRASHTEPRTGGELVHEPLRVRLQSGGNFFASIWFISCLSQSMAKKKSL